MRTFVLAMGTCVALAACQSGPPSVSLDEAKRITATIQEASFTPPPKSIADITAILDDQKRADPAAAERALAAANTEPPTGLSSSALSRFYWDRGLAAGRVGRANQEIADLKKAVDLKSGADDGSLWQLLWQLGLAKTFAGNLEDANRHRLRSIDLIPGDKGGATIARTAVMAIVSAKTGRFEEADDYLSRAEALLLDARSRRGWARRGVSWTVNVDRARGAVLDVRGRPAEAEKFHRAALQGNEESLRRHPSDKTRVFVRDIVLGDLAANLMRQERLVEAEIEARKAVLNTLARSGRYSRETARVVRVLAQLISAQGRHEDAEKLSRATVDIYEKIGTAKESLILAIARGQLAEALVNQERWRQAVVEYETIDTALKSGPEYHRRRFSTTVTRAIALLNVDRAKEARLVARAAVDQNLAALGEKHGKTALARGVLAMTLVRLGEAEAALSAFRQAIPILLSRSRRTTDEDTTRATRALHLQWILESYLELLGNLRPTAGATPGFDAAAEAFRISQVARTRRVQRALAASSARAAARDPDLADLVRREQDAQKQVAALYGLLAEVRSVPTAQQDARAVEDMRGRIDSLRSAGAAIAEEISARFPDYWDLVDPRPATVEEARASLRGGEALIATYVGAKRTYVWAMPKQGGLAFAAVDLGREALVDLVAGLRAALEPNATTLGDIPPFDVAGAHALYKKLLEPVKAGWGHAKSLLVVAHGPLGYLPLSLLPTRAVTVADAAPLFSGYRDVPWLARRHAVTVLPSVASLRTLRTLRTLRALPAAAAAPRRTFVGFGDPYFSKQQE